MTDRRDPELTQLCERVAALEAALASATEQGAWTADAVLVHDVRGAILGANQRAAEMLGYAVDELTRLDLFALEESLSGDDRAAARDTWERLAVDVPITARGRFLRREGPPVPVEFTVVARGEGAARTILLVARDITDRVRVERALRESEQRFRFLFEASPVSMIRCDPRGALVQVNRSLCAWLGLDPEGAPGTAARGLVVEADRLAFDALFAGALAARRPDAASFRLAAASGPQWGRVTLFAETERGELRQVIGVIEDIDARVKAEAQVAALLADLEGQVEGRTAELRRTNELLRIEIGERERAEALLVRARERAEAASQAKSRFLMVMSHELRTPLTAILGYTELHIDNLLEGGESPAAPELLADLRSVRAAGHHLLSHIDDILHMTRLDSGAGLELAHLELAPFLRQLADLARAQLSRPEIDVTLSLGPQLGGLRTDGARLQHVLRHLLRNAAKFTHRGRIDLIAAREPGGGVRIDVCDTGIGIPSEQLGALFAPFVQVDDSPSRRYGGLGLGLALCRRYCAELGGSIAVESVLGRGSRFTVHLPAAPPTG